MNDISYPESNHNISSSCFAYIILIKNAISLQLFRNYANFEEISTH